MIFDTRRRVGADVAELLLGRLCELCLLPVLQSHACRELLPLGLRRWGEMIFDTRRRVGADVAELLLGRLCELCLLPVLQSHACRELLPLGLRRWGEMIFDTRLSARTNCREKNLRMDTVAHRLLLDLLNHRFR